MLYLYYSSNRGMMLCNTGPLSDISPERWQGKRYDLIIGGKIIFNRPFITLAGPDKDQTFVQYAIRIDAVGEPGDEYEDD